MGITSITATVQPTSGRGPRRRVSFLVDSGAIYSVLPARTWKALRLTPTRRARFSMADGTTVVRGVSEARFTIAGVSAPSPVVCGDENDSALLGAVTLEALGLMLNPLTREVLPMKLMLS
jgi:predicted aspartyl protease